MTTEEIVPKYNSSENAKISTELQYMIEDYAILLHSKVREGKISALLSSSISLNIFSHTRRLHQALHKIMHATTAMSLGTSPTSTSFTNFRVLPSITDSILTAGRAAKLTIGFVQDVVWC